MDKELTVREAGERRIVAEITRMMAPSGMLVDGFGHDAAFVDLHLKGDELLMLNTDRSGFNAAFGLGLAGPECVGDFGVSHAVSDIVVAGGTPRAVTVALLLPPDSTLGFVRGVMQGAADAAKRYGAEVVAGDTKQNPKFALVATALGTVSRDKRIRRSGARPGDALVVTGFLGSMLLGLIARKRSLPLSDRARRIVERAIIEQRPPFTLGRAIAEAGVPHAGTDISDGLPGQFTRYAALAAAVLLSMSGASRCIRTSMNSFWHRIFHHCSWGLRVATGSFSMRCRPTICRRCSNWPPPTTRRSPLSAASPRPERSLSATSMEPGIISNALSTIVSRIRGTASAIFRRSERRPRRAVQRSKRGTLRRFGAEFFETGSYSYAA